jgi:hypothetical protein
MKRLLPTCSSVAGIMVYRVGFRVGVLLSEQDVVGLLVEAMDVSVGDLFG